MIVDDRLQMPFCLKNNKVDQVVKKSMETFIMFTMENEWTFDNNHYLTYVYIYYLLMCVYSKLLHCKIHNKQIYRNVQ